jgi:hypothetical protein
MIRPNAKAGSIALYVRTLLLPQMVVQLETSFAGLLNALFSFTSRSTVLAPP